MPEDLRVRNKINEKYSRHHTSNKVFVGGVAPNRSRSLITWVPQSDPILTLNRPIYFRTLSTTTFTDHARGC